MKNNQKYLLLALLGLTVLAYWPLFSNRFAYWDDYFQILGNPVFHQLSWSGLLAIFTPSNNPLGMYQPLPTVFFSAIYQWYGPNPLPFHLWSLALHLLNIFLVYSLVYKLSRRNKLALITAALFALHPIQVETVAWISAASNLLWSASALIAMIVYLDYLQQHKPRQLALVYLLALSGLLAKFAAAVIPLYLYLLDWLKGRWSKRLIWQKIALLVMAFCFGLLALNIRQASHGVPVDLPDYTLGDTIWLSLASPSLHLAKVIWPLRLANFYPYPAKAGYLPWWIYLNALLTLGATALVLISRNKMLLAGSAFYLISLTLIFKIIPSSTPIIADRYLYLAALPCYWLAAEALITLFHWRKNLAIITLVLLLGGLGYLSYSQTKTWSNDLTIWQQVIDANGSARGYVMLGKTYLLTGKYGQALQYFQQAVAGNPRDAQTWNNISVLQGDVYGHWPESAAASRQALDLDPLSYYNWFRLGLAEARLGQHKAALAHLNQAIIINPALADAYYEKALLMRQQKNIKECCRDLAKAGELGYNEANKLYKTLCH